jgi:hypothetical protein
MTLTVTGNLSVGDFVTGGGNVNAVGTIQYETSGSGLLNMTSTSGTFTYANASSSFSGYLGLKRAIGANNTWRFWRSQSDSTKIVTGASPGATSVTFKTFPNTNAPNDPDTLAIKRYYNITPAGGSGTLTATLRLGYASGEVRGGQIETDFSLWQKPASTWVDQLSSQLDTTKNWVEQGIVSASAADWTLSPSGSPLPIQLASFTATTLSNGQVRLNWTTLTETNNYGFEVQKSANTPTNYQTIPNSFIPGHGTTVVPQYYTFTDVNATPGRWYYRLKQIDLDGTVHYSDGTQVDILTGVGGEGTVPTAYEVSQNYPNPFNPSTTIDFAMPERGQVTLKIYNLLGQEVATLINGELSAGRHGVQWNAAGVASGVYLYQLKAGSFVETRKLTLAK